MAHANVDGRNIMNKNENETDIIRTYYTVVITYR